MRKTAFCRLKDGLFGCERWPIAVMSFYVGCFLRLLLHER